MLFWLLAKKQCFPSSRRFFSKQVLLQISGGRLPNQQWQFYPSKRQTFPPKRQLSPTMELPSKWHFVKRQLFFGQTGLFSRNGGRICLFARRQQNVPSRSERLFRVAPSRSQHCPMTKVYLKLFVGNPTTGYLFSRLIFLLSNARHFGLVEDTPVRPVSTLEQFVLRAVGETVVVDLQERGLNLCIGAPQRVRGFGVYSGTWSGSPWDPTRRSDAESRVLLATCLLGTA